MKHNRQGFVAWFIRQAIEGETIKIFGDGKQLRDFNFVDDAIDALLLAAVLDGCNGCIYNLGGDEPVSLLAFVELLLDVVGGGNYEIVPFPEEKKRIDIGDFYADYTKIRSALGWQCSTSLREGLQKTVAYYKKYKKHYWDKS
jgi:UDP-glucose 4-epimerase